MRILQTFDIELWTEPEEQERARQLGLDTTHGMFKVLETHLEETGLLPEKFFGPWDEEPSPMPYFDYVRCDVGFAEPEGIPKHRELSRRIAELTEELEELRSEKALLLQSLEYSEDTGTDVIRKDIFMMETGLKRLKQQEQNISLTLIMRSKNMTNCKNRRRSLTPMN